MDLSKKRILVFASGRGSNFAAIARAIQRKEIPNAEIVALFSNKKNAPALERAKELEIPTHVIASKDFFSEGKFDREAYEKKLIEYVKKMEPDWIVLAGYMLLLGKEIIQEFRGKILNIHPSLLPKYKGLEAQKQAFEAKEKETGCTVHLVTEEMDAGPIVAQSKIPIQPSDTIESLTHRLLPLEHATYVAALRKLCEESDF